MPFVAVTAVGSRKHWPCRSPGSGRSQVYPSSTAQPSRTADTCALGAHQYKLLSVIDFGLSVTPSLPNTIGLSRRGEYLAGGSRE